MHLTSFGILQFIGKYSLTESDRGFARRTTTSRSHSREPTTFELLGDDLQLQLCLWDEEFVGWPHDSPAPVPR